MTSNRKALASALVIQLDRLAAEVEASESGELRHAVRTRGGPWLDKTDEAIHDKRNLMAALRAILKFISDD